MAMQLVSNPWFWISLLVVLGLLALGGFTLWLHGQLRASRIEPPSSNKNPFIETYRDQAVLPEVVQEQPVQVSATSQQAAPQASQRHHSTVSVISGSCTGPNCLGTQPFPQDSTYQPLKRFNSFRSAYAQTDRDRRAEQIMQETTRLLHDIQNQVKALNEFESYDNVSRPPMPNQPLSEFEQNTGWIFNHGPSRQQAAVGLAARPPIPPPTRTSSLPRGQAIQMEERTQQSFPPPPPAELH